MFSKIMVVELNKLSKHIDTFGEELQRTHLAYINDLDSAKQRAKEIINDIIENGLEQTTMLPFPKFKETTKISYKELCDKFSIINLEYRFAPCGGELRWVLE